MMPHFDTAVRLALMRDACELLAPTTAFTTNLLGQPFLRHHQPPPSPTSAITNLRHHQPPPSPTAITIAIAITITNLRHHQPPPSPTSAITNPTSFQAPPAFTRSAFEDRSSFGA
jgi:hypothetical protein